MESALRDSERRAVELQAAQAAQAAAARRAMTLEAEQRAKDLEPQRIHADQKRLFEEALEARMAQEEKRFREQLEEIRASHRPPSPVGEEPGWDAEEPAEEAHEEEGERHQEQWFLVTVTLTFRVWSHCIPVSRSAKLDGLCGRSTG